MCNDGYNGYANRETWAAHLWLSNDEGLYADVRDVVSGHEEEQEAASALKDWFEEAWWMFAETREGRTMIQEIGSLWRVEWEEVARGFTDE